MTQTRVLVAWVLLIIVAVFARFYAIKHLPTSLNWDEVAIYVDVKSIIERGTDMHGGPWLQAIYPSWGDYKLPGYILAVLATAHLLGTPWWLVRIPSAVAGVMTVVVGALVARRLLRAEADSSPAAWWTGLALATAPWSIIFSRSGFEAHLSQLLLAGSVAVMLNQRRTWKQMLVAVLLGAASVYTYYSARFVWPVVFLAWWLLFEFKWTPNQQLAAMFKQVFLAVIVPLSLFFLLLQPLGWSPQFADSQRFRLSTPSLLNETDLVNQASTLRRTAGANPWSRLFYNQEVLRGHELARNMTKHLNLDYMFFSGDQNLRHGTGVHGLFLLAWLPFFCLGILKLVTYHSKATLFLGLWVGVALIPASVPLTVPHALRSLNALVPLAVCCGVGAAFAVSTIKNWLGHRTYLAQAAQAILLLLIGLNFLEFMGFYINRYPVLAADGWSDGYQELADQTIFRATQLNVSRVLIHNFDGRLPLRFLASALIKSDDALPAKSSAFLFSSLGRYQFGGLPSDAELLTLQQTVIVVAHSGMIESYSPTVQAHLRVLDTISSASRQERATIALYTP